jgi:hypothetical protein
MPPSFDLFDTHGNPIQAMTYIPRDRRLTPQELNQLPTLDIFLQKNNSQDVLLCNAIRSKAGCDETESHTFAVDRTWYVDNNTGGHVVRLTDVLEFAC